MILTFETSNDGKSLDIHFDAEGRDQLISLLSNCQKFGDHEHMFRFENVTAPKPGCLITLEQFDEGSNLAEEVTLWMLSDPE